MAREVARVAQRCQSGQQEGNLDLSDCELTQLPQGVFALMRQTKVVSLDLSRNVIKQLTARISIFSYLENLNLCENRLSTLPEPVESLVEMKTLNLSNNDFTQIPDVIFRLGRLSQLDLKNNKIRDIDTDQLKSLSSLQVLDLSENPLSDDLRDSLRERTDWRLVL